MNSQIKFILISVFFICCAEKGGYAQTEWNAPVFTDTLKSAFAFDSKIIAEGRKVYESMCWSCHGLEGKGDGPAAAAIDPKPADHSSGKVQQQKDGNIYWKISTGRGAMQPYGKTLTSKQRWALVSYIRQLGGSSGVTKNSNQHEK